MVRTGVAAVMILLAGCGDDSPSNPRDGGVDDGPDAPDPNLDTDQDGVPDTADLCPGVADPGQVDLDGDHVGWMCDAEESITLPIAGVGLIDVRVYGPTVAAQLYRSCAGPVCPASVLGVGRAGFRRVDSDSMAAADQWASVPSFRSPTVATNEQIYWSSDALHQVGYHDLSTGTFVPQFAGYVRDVNAVRGEVFGLRAGPEASTSSTVLAPSTGGGLQAIGVERQGADPPFPLASPQASDGTPPSVSIPVWDGATATLATWSKGASAWTPVQAGGAPLVGLTQLTMMELEGGGEVPPVPYCALRGGVAYWVEGSVSAVLPFSSCLSVKTFTSAGVRFARNREAIVYLYQGTVRTLTTNVTNVFAVEGVVGDVPAIIVHFLGGLADVWTLNPSGSPVPLFSGVPNPRVSSVGTVLHAIARRGTDFVLVRVRGANAPAETVLPPGDVLSDLFTTYEGAALITSQFSYVVPSQTMVAEPIDLANAIGGVRGAYTVFLARRDASHAPSQPALYAYDEVGGAPRLTTLAPATEGLAYSPIDVPHGPPSKWFVFGLSTCTIAHLATVANTIVLAGSVPCMSPTLTYGYSYTSKGDIVVIEQGGGSRAYLLGPTTGKLVARSTDQLLVFTETGRYDGPRAVALAGTDALGDYICLASNPSGAGRSPSEPPRSADGGASTGRRIR